MESKLPFLLLFAALAQDVKTLPIKSSKKIFPEFILSFFGEEFKAAAYCLMILSFGKMFSAVSGSVGTLLQMAGKQKYFQNVLISAAVLNVILNYFLIPLHGITGAAFASMISNVYWNVLMIIFIKKNFGFYTFYLPFISR